MSRWKAFNHQLQLSDIANDYSNLEDDYYTMRNRLEQVNDDNKALVSENAELRQASLDGIAIADAIEELSQEREKLSVDLADRAATIKRLLEENSELNFKLKQASPHSSVPERDIPVQYESVRPLRPKNP